MKNGKKIKTPSLPSTISLSLFPCKSQSLQKFVSINRQTRISDVARPSSPSSSVPLTVNRDGDYPMLGVEAPSKPFLGVRFFLYGFDHDSHRRIRAKLVGSGAVDVGQYGPNCTHVIVGRAVYDDPICVVAREDGKVVVTGLWVDHSYDIGMLADSSSIMYKPVRDLNGIPGAKNLVMCLTGYQRHDRDDIMIMVSIMGAQFSKPLVAHKVTHLICYKFEGEKYQLAKKIPKIKLVNHKWLEDCLRDWEILPEDNYSKSTYELEMEAEAQDSEEENTENKFVVQPRERIFNRSPCISKIGTTEFLSPMPAGESSKGTNDIASAQYISNAPGLEQKLTPVKDARDSSNVNISCKKILGNPETTIFKASSPTVANVTSDEISPGFPQKSASRSPEDTHTDTKRCSSSYSRKGTRRTSLGLQEGVGHGISNSLETQIGEADNVAGNVSMLEQQTGINASAKSQEPSNFGDVSAEKDKSPQKRKREASLGSSESEKSNMQINLSTMEDPAASDRSQGSEASFLTNQPMLTSDYNFSSGHKESHPRKIADWDAVEREVSLFSASTYHHSDEKQGKTETPLAVISLAKKDKTAASASELMHVAGKTDISSHQTNEAEFMKQASGASSSGRLVEDNNSPAYPKQGSTDVRVRGDDKLEENQKTSVTRKKTLGSRPKLSKSANLKGPMYLRKDVPFNDIRISASGEDLSGHENSSNINDDKATYQHGVGEALEVARSIDVTQSGDMDRDAIVGIDNETEAPDEDDSVIEKINSGEKSKSVETTLAANASEEGERAHDVTEDSGLKESDVAALNNAEKDEKAHSISKGRNAKGKSTEGKKTSIATKKRKGSPAVKEITEHNGAGIGEERPRKAKGKIKRVSKHEISPEADKENRASVNADVNRGKMQSQKSGSKSEKKVAGKNEGGNTNSKSPRLLNRVSEPACFIVSGHRLLRKEFQKTIRRLRGKVCRDSHLWSYQATHFIAPEPIRRTEKFFAAAASGRWILKPDYLNASTEAGKFVDEEPYEWYKKGLIEDAAINLEAPRKWRLLRERTGHGAFYDMRIIIYGDCIAPSLDTLKRVVKAGDGTILATSPPYNRFFSKGIDFAVVSPGMPRVDIWVQEFIKHEIPCVVADYLVEYVCKPGYPLAKHVLYNTRAWAEKSFSRLQSKAEEVVIQESSEVVDEGDLSCAVCGSAERADVMLICGDESGKFGCGIGTHIDCCDPPLETVPSEDWFCPSCMQEQEEFRQQVLSMQ